MKILAIDDNPDNLTALKAVVSERLPEVEVHTALNGASGLALARVEDPDVILLDIVMPGMDGYAVCRQLKADERLQLIPVLFLTALRADLDSRVKALDVGAEGFLSKPFDEVELIAQIRAMTKIKATTLIQRNDKERLAELVAERTLAFQQSHSSMLNLLEDLQVENRARKASELALRESEHFLRESQIISGVGSYVLDIPTGVWKCSDVLSRIFGIDDTYERSIEGWAALIHQDQRTMMADYFRDEVLGRGLAFNKEYRIVRHNDHTERWVRGLGKLEFDARGRPVKMLGTIQDITASKLAELEKAEQLDELRRWHAVTLGRENRIGELKREVNALAERLNLPRPYASPESIEPTVSR